MKKLIAIIGLTLGALLAIIMVAPSASLANITARTITNPATNSSISSAVIRNEFQTLENEITAAFNAAGGSLSSPIFTSMTAGTVCISSDCRTAWPTGSGGGSGGGTSATTTVTQVAHGFTAGQWVALTASTTAPYVLANAVPGGAYQAVGLVSAVTDADTFVLQTSGEFTDTNLIPGMSYYLIASSTSSGGSIVGYPPATTGLIAAPVAIAETQTTAVIQIGRPSIVAASSGSEGMNIGFVSTTTATQQLAILNKNLANKRVRINLPTYSDGAAIYHDRYLVTLYKAAGYYVTYGVTGLGGIQNTSTYNAWKAQVPTEATWAAANGVDEFYIGNEEDWQAQIGNFGGGVTGAGARNDIRSLSSTVKGAHPSLRVVYSTAQGTVAQWGAFCTPSCDFGALDGVGFNMYDTQANFNANLVYFTSQIGAKYFISEWASNYGHYDMVHSHGYTDDTYAADLAYRAGVIQSFGLDAYFFALDFGDNTDSSGNYNILLNDGTFLPGAVSAFGGNNGNAVRPTPMLLSDNQKLYFTGVHTAYIMADSTDMTIVYPLFGSLKLVGGGVSITSSTELPQLTVAYDSSDKLTASVSSTGAVTFNAIGTAGSFNFLDNLGIGTSTPFANLSIGGGAGGTTNLFAIATSTATGTSTVAFRVSPLGNFHLMNGAGIDLGFGATPPQNGTISLGKSGFGTSSPLTQVDILGYMRAIQTSTTTACSPAYEGAEFYNMANHHKWVCDGTNFNKLDN